MNKFPNLEWVEIDGQRVPFTKPQHYAGENNEEVRLTGEKDPLPVQNIRGLFYDVIRDVKIPKGETILRPWHDFDTTKYSHFYLGIQSVPPYKLDDVVLRAIFKTRGYDGALREEFSAEGANVTAFISKTEIPLPDASFRVRNNGEEVIVNVAFGFYF